MLAPKALCHFSEKSFTLILWVAKGFSSKWCFFEKDLKTTSLNRMSPSGSKQGWREWHPTDWEPIRGGAKARGYNKECSFVLSFLSSHSLWGPRRCEGGHSRELNRDLRFPFFPPLHLSVRVHNGGSWQGVGVQKALHLNQVLKLGEERGEGERRFQENHVNQGLHVGKLKRRARWDEGKIAGHRLWENFEWQIWI